MKLSDFDGSLISGLLSELETEATAFVRSCDTQAEIIAEFKAYMRYTGQGWEIPIELSAEQAMNPDAKTYQRLFEQDYAALFGRVVEGMDVEITVWAVNATTPAQTVAVIDLADEKTAAPVSGSREVFDAAVGKSVSSNIMQRSSLQTGHSVAGPAIITEDETTIIVPSSRQAVQQADGCIDIETKLTGNLS